MKRIFLRKILLACVLAAGATAVLAQSSHTVSASWTLSADDTPANCVAPNTCSQAIYRAPQACSTATLFAKLSPLSATATSFVDTTPLFGNSCYAVTFTINGTESVDSNLSGGSLQPAPPTGFTTVSK